MSPSSFRPLPCYIPFVIQSYFEPVNCLFHSFLAARATAPSAKQDAPTTLYDVWLASRTYSHDNTPCAGKYLTPGALRSMSAENVRLAVIIIQRCALQFVSLLWSLHPLRLLLMVSLDLFRGIFPAFRGYSQALIIDEVSGLAFSGKCRGAHVFSASNSDFFR